MGTSRTVTIINSKGLHARPSANFVKLANRFQSKINISADNKKVDGKSIMGMMMLAAAQGSEIIIRANGKDETKALDALCALVAAGFGETD